MKLNVAGAKAIGSSVEGSQQFSMAMNAKAFHTLSSTLYKDKFGAIIREVCSNAYDAHVMVGTPERPFVLTFPDRIDSNLIIRDFGPGISPDDMNNVYCWFFESTKDNDNNAVGAFGLGSKTPFSYTDTFTVTSIHKGMKRIYTAFKDRGMPNLKLMAETSTDEESGLAVSIPVRGTDINSFHKAVLREMRFFAVKPKSNVNWDWPESKTAMDFGSVQFYESDSDVLRGFFVRIGPVGYRIDKEMIIEYARNKGIKLPAMTRHLLEMSPDRKSYGRTGGDYNAILDMPIGTVEVQPSREGIHYTDDTCQNIIDAVLDAEKRVATEIVQRLDDAYAEGCKAFFEMINELPAFLHGALCQTPNFETKYVPFRVSDGGDITVQWDTSIVGISGDDDKGTKRGVALGEIKPKPARGYGSVTLSKTEETKTSFLVRAHEDYGGNITVIHDGIDLFRVDRVYIKDEVFAYKSRIRAHDGGRISYFIEPNGHDVDDLVAYFEQYVEVKRVSELDKNVSRTSKSITGGKVRAWFDVGSWLSENPVYRFRPSGTLYTARVESVFNEDLEDIAEPTVVLRTNNNSLVYACNVVHSKLSLAAALVDAGYKVIAIPQNKKYKNENLCELDSLTDDHHKALKDLLNRVRHSEALRVAHIFSSRFNESVCGMAKRGWLTCKTDDLMIDRDALEKAMGAHPSLNHNWNGDELKIAKEVSGADNVQISYTDIDELFGVVNDIVGTFVVPSERLAKLKDSVSLKAILTDYLENHHHHAIHSLQMNYGYSIIENSFQIDTKAWLLELV